MKAVILAGGYGTRIMEESSSRPKPMIEIGGKPILWHIMKIYSAHGINDFVICCGYKGYFIKEYFSNYLIHMSDIKIEMENNSIEIINKTMDPWKIVLVDTGETTQTGGRLKKVAEHIDDTFCMTYGDGVGSIDISSSIRFHENHGQLATITAVQPPGRFGYLNLDGVVVNSFVEKPLGDGGWINGGFFVLNKRVLDFIDGDDSVWEGGALERLALQNQLRAFFHNGFWQPMDTLRDKNYLEDLWATGNAPWKNWL